MGHRKKKKGDKDRVKQIQYMGVGVCAHRASISIYPLQTCPSGSDSEQEEKEIMMNPVPHSCSDMGHLARGIPLPHCLICVNYGV